MSAQLPQPVESLFPPDAVRGPLEQWLTRALDDARSQIKAGPVTPTLNMATFANALQAVDFAEPKALEDLLPWVIDVLQHGIVQMANPRYFGLFNPAPSFPAQCADRITSVFNPQLASSASSPVPVAIEAAVISALATRAGLRAASGHFASGGSEANQTALLCALTDAHAKYAVDGVRAFAGPVAFYASVDCHIAWLKIAHQCGVGRAALRLVPTDGHGRLDARALADAIAADRASGLVPVMVVATAGSTNGGMIDPLEACADIAAQHHLWYHVDAAWGGAALASERLRGVLSGIERADSITIDAHKWFATTMSCAMFITQRGTLLSHVFHATTSFMPSSEPGIDPYLTSVQWSRRFIGLRLFLSLAAAGWTGMAAHVERSVAVAADIAHRLSEAGWSIINESPLAVLVAVPPQALGPVRDRVRRVVASGQAWVAAAAFEGRDAVRICVTHGETSRADVEELLQALMAPS